MNRPRTILFLYEESLPVTKIVLGALMRELKCAVNTWLRLHHMPGLKMFLPTRGEEIDIWEKICPGQSFVQTPNGPEMGPSS